MSNCNFLSIETSLNRIYLIIVKNKQTFFIEKKNVLSVEVSLNLLIKKIMVNAKINFSDLDFVLVSLGPGSFTGIRIGISAAKAIGTVTGKKIIGFSNFETILFSALKKNPKLFNLDLIVLIQANKNTFYSQRIHCQKQYKSKMKVIDLLTLTKSSKNETFKVGSFLNQYNIKNFTECQPDVEGLLKMINNLEYFSKNNEQKAITPIYIKEHYASK